MHTRHIFDLLSELVFTGVSEAFAPQTEHLPGGIEPATPDGLLGCQDGDLGVPGVRGDTALDLAKQDAMRGTEVFQVDPCAAIIEIAAKPVQQPGACGVERGDLRQVEHETRGRRKLQLRKPLFHAFPDDNPVHDNVDIVFEFLVERGWVFEVVEFAIHLHALIALLQKLSELLPVFAFATANDWREQIKACAFG